MLDKNSNQLESNRLIRLNGVLEILPISRSHWWAGVASGRYPAPVKLSERVTCWRLEDVLKLVETGVQ